MEMGRDLRGKFSHASQSKLLENFPSRISVIKRFKQKEPLHEEKETA